jgi:osmoprotectant transport system ATP-binding protein
VTVGTSTEATAFAPVDAPPDGDDIAIRLDGLTKRYPGSDAPAVSGLDLSIPTGELVALVGPSGCGKTTTLKMINRLIEPTEGTVWVGGTDVRTLPPHELRRGIGYVIQQAGLFPHRKVRDNIATVPKLLGWDKHLVNDRVDELADLLGLDRDMLGRYPSELSGGQQQRVGVARALAADPPVLLMDEPYSAVDPIVRARLQDELLDLQRRVHKTIVLVTHDIDEAIKLADRIVILRVGGILEQVGPPDELLRAPASEFVADFMGDDRGIKRLSLLTVDDVELSEGPVVPTTARGAAARAVAEANRVDWVGVRDADGRLLGWVSVADLPDDASPDGGLAGVELQPFVSVVRGGTALKAALDLIVTSQTRVAMVLDDDGHYRGALTIDDLAEGLT